MTSISSAGLSSAASILQQARQALFQKADTDGSGALSFEEFKAAAPKDSNGVAIAPPPGAPSAQDLFAKLDTNKDGSLTQSELDAGQKAPPGNLLSSDTISQLLNSLSSDDKQAFLKEADTDGDGSISPDELKSAVSKLVDEATQGGTDELIGGLAAGGKPHGGHGGPHVRGGSGGDDDSTQQVFDILDTNQDGKVSIDELLASTGSSETSTTNSASLTSSQSSDKTSSDFLNALKTAANNFLLSLQEQQAA